MTNSDDDEYVKELTARVKSSFNDNKEVEKSMMGMFDEATLEQMTLFEEYQANRDHTFEIAVKGALERMATDNRSFGKTLYVEHAKELIKQRGRHILEIDPADIYKRTYGFARPTKYTNQVNSQRNAVAKRRAANKAARKARRK